jgi:pimeloyl-ACP methyl ester carboxylesterase
MSNRLLITIIVAILIYCAIAILAYFRQDSMIYFPNRFSRSALADRSRRLGLTLWPADATDYHGFIGIDFSGQPRGVVLVFHGNAGSAIDRMYYIAAIQRLGYRVIVFEYPGYGARSGRMGETAFIAEAEKAARAAIEEFGGPLYVWGESLGCAIASALASMKDIPVKGVILATPWDTLPNLAQNIYWFLPVRWMVRDRYDNISNLRDYTGPVAVIMAGEDEVIPNRRTMNLYESLGENKRLWILENVGHNDWLGAVDDSWWEEVMDFVDS